MSDILRLDQLAGTTADLVGGKALALGRMIEAGLPVPPGYCISTAAYRRLRGRPPQEDPDLTEQIIAAYAALGSGSVAVRSSAVGEDSARTSFAGQHHTSLGVSDAAELLRAVHRCWQSLDSEPARAYRAARAVDAPPAMAVVVQRLVPSEVAGVLFTRDPLHSAASRMMVEASSGMGEALVSGRIAPDRYCVDRDTGRVLERHRGRPEALSFPEALLSELADFGRQAENLFGGPCDLEWAWAEGTLWLLQARPITSAAAEREEMRLEEIAAARQRAEPRGTVWSRFNLAETLPEPTPMTWSLIRQMQSGRGGLGLMYRDLGFQPDPALADEGVYDLIAGRIYCNLSREPRMEYAGLPLEHSWEQLKAEPSRALYPQPALNLARAGWRFWLGLPATLWRLGRSSARLRALSREFPRRFHESILPAYLRTVEREAAVDLTRRTPAELLDDLHRLVRLTLYDFARESLKPAVLAALALQRLEQRLGPAAVRQWVTGVQSDPSVDLTAALCALAAGRLTSKEFLHRFGHRGTQDLELAQPRWAEEPAAVSRLLEIVRPTLAPVLDPGQPPRPFPPALEREVKNLQVFLGLRETAKHYFLQGYALLRRVLLELGQRYSLQGGIFFLTIEDLPRLIAGEDFNDLIRQRQQRRRLLLSLEAPSILFSDDLEAIGRPQQSDQSGAEAWRGVPMSPGVAEAEALVLESPVDAEPPARPYILVCPSTDPAWVPLFLSARGLVTETGGVLSHGAIVARELGLPAVTGIPHVHRRLSTGQRLRLNGTSGELAVLEGNVPPGND